MTSRQTERETRGKPILKKEFVTSLKLPRVFRQVFINMNKKEKHLTC